MSVLNARNSTHKINPAESQDYLIVFVIEMICAISVICENFSRINIQTFFLRKALLQTNTVLRCRN